MLATTALAFLMIVLDYSVGAEIVEKFPFLEMSPPAARSILSSIVSAMVSTTGVVFFSIRIAADPHLPQTPNHSLHAGHFRFDQPVLHHRACVDSGS